jgi:hypothetical protein
MNFPPLPRQYDPVTLRALLDSIGYALDAIRIPYPTTVDALPDPIAMGVGARAFVTDATATTFASTVAGGGSNKVPVYSNGANWKIG